MAGENEVMDEQEQNEASEGGENKAQNFLQSNIAKMIVRILGWVLAIGVGVALMFLTATLVLELRGDAPEEQSIIAPPVIESTPIYAVHPLDTFTINLDKRDDSEKTTIVTAKLVLAYPQDRKDVQSEINQRKEQLSDAIQSIIARKRFEDINTANKRENFLKQELITEVNRNLINKGIVDIYITKFEISRL